MFDPVFSFTFLVVPKALEILLLILTVISFTWPWLGLVSVVDSIQVVGLLTECRKFIVGKLVKELLVLHISNIVDESTELWDWLFQHQRPEKTLFE